MAFGTACPPAPARRSSGPVASRAATSCPPESEPAGLRGQSGPRPGRIHDAATFAALRRSRVRGHAGPLSITWAPRQGDGSGAAAASAVVAYAVPTRVGNAVVRNRLRRRLRAVLQRLGPPPGAYLVTVRPHAADLSSSELKVLVSQVLLALSSPKGPEATP